MIQTQRTEPIQVHLPSEMHRVDPAKRTTSAEQLRRDKVFHEQDQHKRQGDKHQRERAHEHDDGSGSQIDLVA